MPIKPVEILIKARDEASGVFGSLQSKAAAVGVAIAGYFGFSAFVGAIKGAGELEAKLSEVKAVSGATADEMVLLRKAAEDAGASTKYTATEGAGALANLTRAGLSAKDAIGALPAVLNLAQAGGVDLGQASEFVTRAVNGMGLAFSDAGRVADVLAAGANGSNASVKGLAEALSYAAPVAHSVGLSLEATVAIIGKFSDAGIDASRAGTALNAVLSQFSDPSSKFKMELAAAGITTRDFEKALRQLAAAGPAGEKAILAVGTEAGPAMRALLGQGIGALDELKGKLTDAAGSAAATAKVMEDNLPGAMNSLSSAWDTVKNALATPVLPVLKDAVNELAGSLRGAVENGTVGKFGDSLVTAFQAGLKWAREFAGQVDFAALTAKMQGWAESAGATFTKVGEYATNTGNIVQTVFGVMSAGINTVLTVIYKLAEAFAGVAGNIQSGLALLMEGLSKVTFGGVSASFKLAAEEIRLSAEATGAVSEAFAAKASQAFDAAADGAAMAQRGWEGLTASTAKAADQASTSAQVMQTVAATLQEVGNQAQAVGDKAQAGAAKQQAAAEQARAAVAKLRTEYEAALAGGDVQLAVEKMVAINIALQDVGNQATAVGEKAKAGAAKQTEAAEQARAAVAKLRTEYEAALEGGNVQLAVEKMVALKKAINDVSNAAKDAKEKAKDVSDAFTVLGVTSTADLVKQREAAVQAYKTIRDSGLGTAEDLRKSWAVVAEKTIAANGGVATAALKSEAAMRGLRITTDETGKSIVESMTIAANAIGKASKAIETAGKAQQANFDIKQSAIKIALEEQRAIEEVARTLGNESTVIEAQREIRRLEIEQLRLTAEAKRAEAKSAIASAEALRAELVARGELTEVRRLEIESSIAAAKAKENEARVADVTANKLAAMADISARSGKAASDSRSGYDSAAAGLDKMAEASERAAAAERKRLNVDKDGFTLDKNGQRLTMGGQVKIPEGYYFDSEAANKDPKFRSGQSDGSQYVKKTPEKEKADEAQYRQSLEDARNKGNGSKSGSSVFGPRTPTPSSAPLPSPTPAPDPLLAPAPAPSTGGDASELSQLIAQLRALTAALSTSGRTVTLNLGLNGTSYGSVSTNEAGEATLQRLLSQLNAAQSRSS